MTRVCRASLTGKKKKKREKDEGKIAFTCAKRVESRDQKFFMPEMPYNPAGAGGGRRGGEGREGRGRRNRGVGNFRNHWPRESNSMARHAEIVGQYLRD